MKAPPLYDDLIWQRTATACGLAAFAHEDAPPQPGSLDPLRAALRDEVPLDEADSTHWLHGRFRGRELVLRRHGATAGCSIDVALDPPLRLGLRVAPLPVPALLRVPTVRDLFTFRAHDGRHTSELFTATDGPRALAGALLRLHPAMPHLSDHLVGLGYAALPLDAASFLDAVTTALTLAEQLVEVRRALPVLRWEEVLARDLQSAAASLGGAFDEARVALTVEVDGVPVEITAPLGEDGLGTVLRATIEPPLALGLRLGKEGRFAGLLALVGAGDLQTGDRAFDGAFHLAGENADAVRAALGEAARALLLAARAQGAEVTVTDAQVELRHPRAPKGEDELIRLAVDAAALVRALRGSSSGSSPYR